jgi:uncharacterized protein VirK/YbjX
MKLFENQDGWSDLALGRVAPSVTLGQGVSARLARLPYLRERIKLHARALFHRSHTRAWIEVLNSHPAFAEYIQHCPRLVDKIYRPYLTTKLGMSDRLAVLRSHYQFMFRHGLGQMIAQATRTGVTLGSIEGKTGARYQVRLRAVEPMEREGELVMQLVEGTALVYSVAFTFSDLHGFSIVSVGCIQGPKDGDGLGSIRQATRELHGMRPKQLLVCLVRQLGYELGCTQMRLVGNANRVVHGAMRQGRVLADYDQLWAELGAEKRFDGDFQLPCEPIQPPDLEKICSKKRSEARKRHNLAMELATEVARNFCVRPAFQQTNPAQLGLARRDDFLMKPVVE